MDEIGKRFFSALSEFGIGRLIDGADRIIVGFSGGADSRVLLILLNKLACEKGKEIICAHVNHMIRGNAADEDEIKCVKWAEESGVPIRICRANIPAIAKQRGKGVEETARDERYRFFEAISKELGGKSLIATAHNADDNLETVLFNLLRGAGTHGMCGIPPVRDDKYIRPLILCSSSSIRKYCIENEIEYNVDSTNENTEYTRNYIRNSIVPLLKEITDDPEQAVLRMCSNLRTDDEFLSMLAEDFIEKSVGSLTVSSLFSLHSAVLSRVIDRLYRKAGGKRSLSKIHIDAVSDAIKNKKGAVILNLPCGIRFIKSKNHISFENGVSVHEPIEGSYSLCIDGNPFVFEDCAVSVSSALNDKISINNNIYNLSIHKKTDFDKIKGSLSVRGKVEGDTFKYGGMTRKVRKLFSEAGIPFGMRRSVPIICDEDGIVWIPGFPLRDGMETQSNKTDKTVFICYYKKIF